MNGTMNRYRVISIVGSLDLSEEDQNLAFDHIGHPKDINKHIHQIPQAERQLATTGRILSIINQNKQSSLLLSNDNRQSLTDEKRKLSSPPISSCSFLFPSMITDNRQPF